MRSFLVTGANQGIGLQTVRHLSLTPYVLVFMGSRKLTAAEEAKAGFESDIHPTSAVVPIQLDITDEGSISAAHATIVEHLQTKNLAGLDVLVNNAAIITPSFQETYAVNVFGTVALTEHLRPLINRGGTIINLSSAIGSLDLLLKNPNIPSMPAYSSSKTALNNLTVQWALQERKKGSGIRVVSICPGFVSTRMNNNTGTMTPAEGCQIVVATALETEGRTGVYFNKDGDLKW
ncbi:Short-chain dehydrogenase/reductase family protein [Mycena venus]|uniref:Short-chain dehydrogenase/reductase family protein n=1 Tax=Mycena venus TaxID=2733690 RepID=A0A8H7CNZ1_9AGAR|nr:Short-chain dehydrogenase/reductase family protein [Mycena venus]